MLDQCCCWECVEGWVRRLASAACVCYLLASHAPAAAPNKHPVHAESMAYPADDEDLHALGWGALDPDNSRPAFSMQDLGLPAVGREQCRRLWGYAGAGDGLVGEGHICAGLQSQRNICFGDSGGPLLLRGGGGGGAGSDVQIGLTSFTFPTCALPGMPSVFTFIPHYRHGHAGQRSETCFRADTVLAGGEARKAC